jgi:hypothetical protein
MQDPAKVPILSENFAFVHLERARLSAISEYEAAGDPSAQLEATMVLNWLYSTLLNTALESIDEVGELSVYDTRREVAVSYFDTWREDAHERYPQFVERQNQLVAEIGRPEAQRVADERATPRVQALHDEVLQVLKDRTDELAAGLRAQGIEPEPVPSPTTIDSERTEEAIGAAGSSARSESKICPDCAEEIKAAARVCRFCGFRFSDPPPESAGAQR